MATKNVANKRRNLDNPYAQWTDLRTGWEYKLLKAYGNNSKPYARWHVGAKSEYTFGDFDMGDEYVSSINPTTFGIGLVYDTEVWSTYREFFNWVNGVKE